jgi:hypothetical protein
MYHWTGFRDCDRGSGIWAVAAQLGYPGIFTVGTGMAVSAIGVFLIWGNHDWRSSIGFCIGRDPDYYRRS